MSLGVYDYLAWQPAELETAAVWFADNARLLEWVAGTVRDGAERGTEAQHGEFIDSVRDDADTTSRRIYDLADMMDDAKKVLRSAGSDLTTLVGHLRSMVDEAEAADFVVEENADVIDSRRTFDSAEERVLRESEAQNRKTDIGAKLNEIRQVDDDANHRLHGIVGRDVRDRTPEGNGGLSTTIPAAAGGTLLETFKLRYEAMVNSGQWESSTRMSSTLRGYGAAFEILGFIGGVANAPEEEPLHETLLAEGAGVLGGLAGSTGGLLLGTAAAGPLGGLVSHFTGGALVAGWASSEVREAFDRAN